MMNSILESIGVPNQICIIHNTNGNDRKRIHEYLEQNYSSIRKMSMLIDSMKYEVRRFIRCPECGVGNLLKHEDYHIGFMLNNEDEFYSIDCCECGNRFMYECNCDNFKGYNIPINNCVICGNIPMDTHTLISNHPETINNSEIEQILSHSDIHTVILPKIMYSIHNRPIRWNKKLIETEICKGLGI